jgi:hypothetical protein
MVKNTTSGTNENINTALQFTCLILNTHTTVDGQRVVLIGRMLNGLENLLNLNSKFTSRC